MTVLSLVTLVLILVALTGGLAAHRRALRPPARAEPRGPHIEDLLTPLSALTGLILAFVLVQTFISFREARQASVHEAGDVLGEFRAAALLHKPTAVAVRASISCYARSVIAVEWPAMDRRASAAMPDLWASGRSPRLARSCARAPRARGLGRDLGRLRAHEEPPRPAGRGATKHARRAELAAHPRVLRLCLPLRLLHPPRRGPGSAVDLLQAFSARAGYLPARPTPRLAVRDRDQPPCA